MSSIIKNVVHWGSHSQRQKTPVQVDLCEVFCFFFFNLFFCVTWVLIFFMQRSVAKSQNLLTKVSSIHTAVGAAHGTGKDLIQPPVYFVDVVQQASPHSPISVQKHMLGILNTSNISNIIILTLYLLFRREGVLQGQVESCELCGMQPRMVGTMCIPCDRLVCVGPRLKELNVDGSLFKNRKLSCCLSVLIYLKISQQFAHNFLANGTHRRTRFHHLRRFTKL